MNALNFTNKWILITGASSGLGYEMAMQLAHQHKANLIITARRADKLLTLKTILESAGIQVKVIVADLSVSGDIERVIKESTEGQALYAAILNAGITYFGNHADLHHSDFDKLIQTNVTSVSSMASELVKYFEKNGQEGGVMAVSSMAALFPVPYQSLYSASKAFILTFFHALSHEIQNPGLSLTVYAPGGIVTEMTGGEAFNDLRAWLMPVKQAAKEGIYALQYRKKIHIPGLTNRIGNRLMQFLPKQFILRQLARKYKKSLAKIQR